MAKRVGIFADTHCGHMAGLTPPEWFSRIRKMESSRLVEKKLYGEHSILWDWIMEKIDNWGPFDISIWNGDLIDGKGHLSGGTEQWTTDRVVQSEMAAYCINAIGGAKKLATYGTRYHTSSDGEDWEDVVIQMAKAQKLEGHGFYEINGCVLDVKHQGKTSLKGERIANIQWAARGQNPVADIVIRSHRHTFEYVGASGWIAISTPALQGWGSKYGVRQCSKTIDFGFIVIDIEDDGMFSWEPVLYRGKAQTVTPTIL
jgi:hypothetical protein